VSRRRTRSIRRWTASKKGLVASTYGDPTPERGGRAKRYFTVTARGVHAVACAQRAFQRLMKGLVLPGGAGA
jgi:PadR family transcriptional regulator, regulatory protein PadR